MFQFTGNFSTGSFVLLQHDHNKASADFITTTYKTSSNAELPFTMRWSHRFLNAAVGSPRKKVQIAIVGSGPSGCYVADFLTRNNPHVHVDMFEKLPVPFGLSRYGVAPDHPEVKNVEQKFKEMFESKRVSWLGNVEVGKELPLDVLRSSYTAVVLATGAYGERRLDVPGEELGNVFNARQFVNYYNTYPYPHGSPQHCPFEFQGKEPVRDVVIIGNGNVSLDLARVLGTSYKRWCPTDMNGLAIQELMLNRIEHHHLCTTAS